MCKTIIVKEDTDFEWKFWDREIKTAINFKIYYKRWAKTRNSKRSVIEITILYYDVLYTIVENGRNTISNPTRTPKSHYFWDETVTVLHRRVWNIRKSACSAEQNDSVHRRSRLWSLFEENLPLNPDVYIYNVYIRKRVQRV